MAMNKEFTDLVQEYLTDGIISAKERAVLLKKAESLEIDVVEAELYIAAQEQKENIKVALAEKKKKGKTCPFCGGPINDLTDKCPHIGCGKPITPEATRELQEILDNLEDALVAFKAGKNIAEAKALVERYARKAKLYYSNNAKVTFLLEEIKKEVEVVDAKAKKMAVLNALAKRWKLVAGVVAVIVLAIVIMIKSRPTVENNLQLCIEAVNESLEEGNFGQAVALCTNYFQNHNDYDDAHALEPASGAIIRFQTKELTNFIDSGDLRGAISYLQELSILPAVAKPGTSNVLKMYDSIFLKLVTEFVNRGDLDSAETTALIWKSKLNNDLSWKDSSCYTLLKNKYRAAGRDFSLLRSDCDYN